MSYSYLRPNEPVMQFIVPVIGIVKFQIQHYDDQSAYVVFVNHLGDKIPPPQGISLWRVTFFPPVSKRHPRSIETERLVVVRANEYLIHWEHNYEMRFSGVVCYRLIQERRQSYAGLGANIQFKIVSEDGSRFISAPSESSSSSSSSSSSDTSSSSSSSSSEEEEKRHKKNKSKKSKSSRMRKTEKRKASDLYV
jgi:hypothetical protein